MAVTNTPIDRTTTYGQLLSNLMLAWDQVLKNHDLLRSKMIADGYDDSSATNGALFGLGTVAQAHAVFLQIDSVAGAVGLPATNPGSTTITKAGVYAAIQQMIAQVG